MSSPIRPVVLACALAPSLALSLAAQPVNIDVLMVRPGDPAATEKRAASFLKRLGSYLQSNVVPFVRNMATVSIANSEEKALEIIGREHPALVFAPFAFYLKHLRVPGQPTRIVAHVPRFGTAVERYYLISTKRGGATSVAELRGKLVHVSKTFDRTYLERVVLPKEAPARHFTLRTSPSIADDVFVMTEGAEEGETVPDALLVDEELKRLLAADDLVWPSLQVVWTSAALPRDVVVLRGQSWCSVDVARQLLTGLSAMSKDDAGREILKLMRSDGIVAPDTKLLERTAKAYDAAARPKPAKGRPKR